jgi:hypothetical protein
MRRMSAALVALTAAIALLALGSPAWAAPKPKPKSFSVKPTEVRAGQEVRTSGKGCHRRQLVRIYLDNKVVDWARADNEGEFVEFVRIFPNTSTGTHTMRARCDRRELGSVKIEVRRRGQFAVSPDRAPAGSRVTVSGSGCKPHSKVVIKFDGKKVGSTRADDDGRFSKRVRIPKKAEPGGEHFITVRCDDRFLGSKRFTVLEPDYGRGSGDLVTTDRTTVAAGETVTVTGENCPDQTPVAKLDGKTVALTVASQGKGFTAKAAIPKGTAPGRHQLQAGCDAGSAGTTTLTVLDPEDTVWAGAEKPAADRSPNRDLAIVAGLLAGVAILLASLQLRRRGNRG